MEAGEDIRYLWRDQAEAVGLLQRDFWLFDSQTIAVFRFDGDRTLGVEVSQDPAEVLAGCQARDAAEHFAVRYTDFTAEVASGV